jgi:anti-sigma B factor antagonist
MDAPIRHRGGVSIIELPNRLVRGEATATLQRSIQELLDARRVHIVLDMGRVTFMDSSSLAELLACHRRVVGAGGELKLLKPSGRILDLLDITNLRPLFQVFEDETAALESF